MRGTPPAEDLQAVARGVFEAHPLRVAGDVRLSLFEHRGGADALLVWFPVEGGDPRTLEQTFRSEGYPRARFLEYFHCAFHGFIGHAMTQWEPLTAPATDPPPAT